MPASRKLSRREALKRTVTATTVFASGMVSTGKSPSHAAKPTVPDANSQLRMGVIGTGVRGKHLIGNLPTNVNVVAICDCAESRLANTVTPEKAFAEVLNHFTKTDGKRCAKYQDYRKMIEREKLDAVIIVTPDHHHAQAGLLALQAGLDVYLEKPLAVTIHEGQLLVETVKKTGRVLQVGSQQRTMEINRFACEFIRNGGLGRIIEVRVPNYPGPLTPPTFATDPIPKGLDWKQFLGPAPKREHHKKLWVKDEFKVGDLLWRGWDLWRDYSGHLTTNWGAHSIDMVQYALGMDDSGPVEIHLNEHVTEQDLQEDWKRKWIKKTPGPVKTFQSESRFHAVSMKYSNGTLLHFMPGMDVAYFRGEKGRMTISRNKYKIDKPELITDAPDASLTKKWEGTGHVARPHLENWIQCIHSRQKPNAPVEVGHRSVTVCHLANIARELGRLLRWDPAVEQFESDQEANTLLQRPRREGFALPKSS